MPIMAIGNGSMNDLESPFTTGEPFSKGTLPPPKLECGAIWFEIANDSENNAFRDCYVSRSTLGGEVGLKRSLKHRILNRRWH